ncbi:MAG TPA: pyrimidine-nucleoside phosphorylase [Candidatus Dormibacteraeota bacterium]|nr:pyrimidine-nucleoside phosphorylase [Candidatus Dormibacteraeota bacterium]
MRMYDIIENKRDGKELSEEEINYFIQGFTKGHIPDYQISALLMAIYFQGMTDHEQVALTAAMAKSGDQIDLSAINGIKVDKHSTGGVGDTTTLILAPLVASLGVPVAKMSGRGLGHTGGTIDKLEAVPGFHVEISNDEFINLVNKNKVAVIGQSSNLTPADKKIYSLRDVTATVNSIPLIASSIMSKKIAAGANAIVLDVKVGEGAFMKDIENAKKLAEAMVTIGNQVGRKTMAVISDMSQPLGRAIGNALEVQEAIETLRGEGPEDLTELCLTLGSQMVYLANKADNLEDARKQLETNLKNGKALEQFKLFLRSQGGDERVVDQPQLLPQAKFKFELPAKKAGVVTEIIANEIGKAALMLGAGRETQKSVIDLSVGIVLHKKIGDKVEQGETLLTIHANKSSIDAIKDKLYQHINISNKEIPQPTLIHNTI